MRVVILTVDLPEANRLTEAVVGSPCEVVGILDSATLVPGNSNVRAVRWLSRRVGVGFLLHRALEWLICWLAGAVRRLQGRRPLVGSVSQISATNRIPVHRVRHIDDPVIERVRGWAPDLIVSTYFNQIIKPNLLEIPRLGCINVHPSLLPCHRGLLPTFWTLAYGDQLAGVSVHQIDQSIDTGDLFAQRTVAVSPHESAFSLAHRCCAAGAELLPQIIRQLGAGELKPQPQSTRGASYHSWPNRAGLKRLREQGHGLGSVREMWNTFYRGLSYPPAPIASSGDRAEQPLESG